MTSACKTLGYLLDRFHKSSQKNETLFLITDLDIVIDNKLLVSHTFGFFPISSRFI